MKKRLLIIPLLIYLVSNKIQAQSFQNPIITTDTVVYIGVANSGTPPEFPYGEKKFTYYIKKYMCPTYKANKLKGSILFSFVIEKDGSVTHPKIEVEEELPKGVLEDIKCAINCMPLWKPAISCISCTGTDFGIYRYRYYRSIDQEKCIYFPSDNLK